MNTNVITYVNKRNPNKRIDVKHTSDRHYMWRQRMCFDNGVENFVGTKRGGFRRQGVKTIREVLEDYSEIWRIE